MTPDLPREVGLMVRSDRLLPMKTYHRRDLLKIFTVIGAAGLSLPAADLAFPKGAVIRTVLKDAPPESISAGATLFHEHMSLAADFMPRWIAYSRHTDPPTTPPPAW